MFNFGIFRKTLLDSAVSVLVSMAGLVAFVVLFVWAMLNMGTELMAFVSRFSISAKNVRNEPWNSGRWRSLCQYFVCRLFHSHDRIHVGVVSADCDDYPSDCG